MRVAKVDEGEWVSNSESERILSGRGGARWRNVDKVGGRWRYWIAQMNVNQVGNH